MKTTNKNLNKIQNYFLQQLGRGGGVCYLTTYEAPNPRVKNLKRKDATK